jgi:5-methyltetrahydropteroyltriglutamate--homocysteine methyltransferase
MSELLPTTMVGSYPRPHWFGYQLSGRDVREAFKSLHHEEAFKDAVGAVIADQEHAGLDIVTDGQMWFDDYAMGIGSFLWYWFERLEGFGKERLEHPARARGGVTGSDAFVLDEAGGVALVGPLGKARWRMAELYVTAQTMTDRPVKASIGAGPLQLSAMVHFDGAPIRSRHDLARAMAPYFRQEIDELVEAGCTHIQIEDLGAWFPNVTGERDVAWIREVITALAAGVTARVGWHFCLGNAWGTSTHGLTAGGYGSVLEYYLDLPIDEFVLDFAARGMSDVGVLRAIPDDKAIAAGVIDVRNLEVEQPEQVAERIRRVLEYVPAERVTLTTDCGMKQLPRTTARAKLRALVEGAGIVRAEVGGARSAPGRTEGVAVP